MIAIIFKRLKQKSEILGIHPGDVLTPKIVFFEAKRVSKIKLILKAFWHRFWDDFRRSWNVKNEQKRKSVALFLIFGVCNIRRCFGAILGGSWKGFGSFLDDFGWILKPKLEAEKVISDT